MMNLPVGEAPGQSSGVSDSPSSTGGTLIRRRQQSRDGWIAKVEIDVTELYLRNLRAVRGSPAYYRYRGMLTRGALGAVSLRCA